MNLSKVEKIIIVVLVIGGILAAGFFLLFKPAYDGIAKAEKNLKTAETAHAELMTKLERLNTIDEDIKTARSDVGDLEEKFFPDLTTYEAVEILLAQLKEYEMDTLEINVAALTTEDLELEYFIEEPIIYDLKTYAQNAKEHKEGEIELMEGEFLDGNKKYTIIINGLADITITDENGEVVENKKYTDTMTKAYKEALCRYAFTNKIKQTVSVVALELDVTGEYKDYLEFLDYLYNFDRATYLPEVEIPMAFTITANDEGKFITEWGTELDIEIEDGYTGDITVDLQDEDIVSEVPVKVVFYGVEQIEELPELDISGTKVVTNQ